MVVLIFLVILGLTFENLTRVTEDWINWINILAGSNHTTLVPGKALQETHGKHMLRKYIMFKWHIRKYIMFN